MTRMRTKECESCKGRGYIWVYVSEAAEMKERFIKGVKRIIAIFKRRS